MSRIIGSRRASGLRAILVPGLFACAVQACNMGASPQGTGAPAAGAEDVTTVRRAATGVICDPNPMVPCITTNNGRVLHNLKIVNMFMSAHWDDENPPAFSKQAINDFTQRFVTAANANRYFASARTDYENAGGSVSFGGSFEATGLERGLCPTPSFDHFSEAAAIHFWINCLTAPGPIPVSIDDLGIRSTIGNIPPPDDSTLYVIYVPDDTNVIDAVPIAGQEKPAGFRSCASGPGAIGNFDAYHFWQENAKWEFEFLDCHLCVDDACKPLCCLGGCTLGTPFTVPQSYAYAVVPVECASNDPSLTAQQQFNLLTQHATHEIIEAAVDPIVPTGWFDRGKQEFFPLFNPFTVLREGEISDICASATNPTVALADGTSVSTYWSTSAGACVPRPLVNAKCKDVTVSTAAGTCSAPASVDNGSSEPSGGALTITQSPPSPYGLGTTTVTLTATSATSDSATCTGKVTVEDHTPPTFTFVPGPITVPEGTTPNIGTATATDFCPGAVTVTNNAPASFPIGVTTVTWTARDAAGNTATAQQTVRITCAGGPSSCPDGHGCQTNDDCGSRVCTNLVCAPPACAPRCNRGALCGANADCGSQVCTANTCRAPACSPRCGQAAICGDNGDCLSFICTNNRCAPPSCSPNCNQGAPCAVNGDCLARRCLNGQCAPPTCSPACGTGALCNNNGDCRSHVCNGNRCT